MTVLESLGRADGDRVTLTGSRCLLCGRVEFPALGACPVCGATAEATALGPQATLTGFTEVLHPPPGAEVEVPYTLVVGAFADANLAVMGLLDPHVPSEELVLGQVLEVCAVTTRTTTTYGFRLA